MVQELANRHQNCKNAIFSRSELIFVKPKQTLRRAISLVLVDICKTKESTNNLQNPNICLQNSCFPCCCYGKKESFKWLRGNETRSGKTHHASWTNIACYWLPYRTMSTARSIFSSEMLYSRKQTSHIMLQGIKHKLLSWPSTVVKLERTISPFTSSAMSYIIS